MMFYSVVNQSSNFTISMMKVVEYIMVNKKDDLITVCTPVIEHSDHLFNKAMHYILGSLESGPFIKAYI